MKLFFCFSFWKIIKLRFSMQIINWQKIIKSFDNKNRKMYPPKFLPKSWALLLRVPQIWFGWYQTSCLWHKLTIYLSLSKQLIRYRPNPLRGTRCFKHLWQYLKLSMIILSLSFFCCFLSSFFVFLSTTGSCFSSFISELAISSRVLE